MPLFSPLPQHLIVANEAITTGGASHAMVATNVYLYAFEILVVTTYTGAKWRVSSTAVGSTDVGVYTFAGTLLGSLGGIANTSNTSMSGNFATPILCGPGQYFMALACSGAEPLYSVSSFNNVAVLSRCRVAVNGSAGTPTVLPSSTGGYTNAPAVFPAFSLIVSGGLT